MNITARTSDSIIVSFYIYPSTDVMGILSGAAGLLWEEVHGPETEISQASQPPMARVSHWSRMVLQLHQNAAPPPSITCDRSSYIIAVQLGITIKSYTRFRHETHSLHFALQCWPELLLTETRGSTDVFILLHHPSSSHRCVPHDAFKT